MFWFKDTFENKTVVLKTALWRVSLWPPDTVFTNFYLKMFPSVVRHWSQDTLGTAGEFILFYLICFADSLALVDSRRAHRDSKLPDLWRPRAAGRRRDSAQRCRVRAASREKNRLPLLRHPESTQDSSSCFRFFLYCSQQAPSDWTVDESTLRENLELWSHFTPGPPHSALPFRFGRSPSNVECWDSCRDRGQQGDVFGPNGSWI